MSSMMNSEYMYMSNGKNIGLTNQKMTNSLL